MESFMHAGKLRGFLLVVLLALGACNRPEASSSIPQTQLAPQPVAPSESIPTEADLNKAFLPAISANVGTPQGVQVDPHVEILVNQTEVKVGEVITITGRPVELGLPYFYLIVRDEGVQQVEPLVQVTYDNQVKPMSGTSQILEIISSEGKLDLATFQLKAIAPGQTTITISATGEVNVGSSGSYMWSGGGSGDVLIVVSP
jgi:hypothetical protein